jgi:tetratricopeptide (TPR) repeat protein
MNQGRILVFAAILCASSALWAADGKQGDGFEAGKVAYEASEYARAVQLLQAAAAREPQNAEIQLLLTKSHLELQQHDAAIRSAERAVALKPKSSLYHEWLGRAFGEKADHASWFSAISLAKKTHQEFETAVELDERNFSARQALVEFECSAPGMVGGGEDKAQVQIRKLAEMDAAEGHYAKGNCHRQKKDFAVADAEFAKALESNPKSDELVYDIGDYAVKRAESERLLKVAEVGERLAPGDPRYIYFRAVALVLKKEKPREAELMLREYLKKGPVRAGYPRPGAVHMWLGHLYESEGKLEEAESELRTAVKIDPKYKPAQEALNKLKKN